MIDFVAGGLELLGLWLVGSRKPIGFILNCIACIIWVYVAISSGVYGLLLVVIPAIFINVRNFIKWVRVGLE
jgi:nicotinamide riboside transporter PnuC